MILNYLDLDGGAAINVFPIADSHLFSVHSDWKEQSAYYFTGLEYRMLVCPSIWSQCELLLERPGLYLKTNIPLGGMVYLPQKPANFNHSDCAHDLEWMVESYLFKFNSLPSRSYDWLSRRRLYIDRAGGRSALGLGIFDHSRLVARGETRDAIELLNQRYADELFALVASRPDQIQVGNYAQTSLTDEVCTHTDFLSESMVYLRALRNDDLETISHSRLTATCENVTCSRKYNRSLLSFYLTAIREPHPNEHGAYIALFKNFYNILEYFMEGEGQGCLTAVLDKHVGTDRLQAIVADIEKYYPPESTQVFGLTHGKRISTNVPLPTISSADKDIAQKVGYRLYKTRNAVLHSKKTYQQQAVLDSIKPGPNEASQLDTDLALIRPIAELILEEADPDA